MYNASHGLHTAPRRTCPPIYCVSRRLRSLVLLTGIWLVFSPAGSQVAAYDLPFYGVITRSGADANSGAGRIYYPTAQLSKGTIVHVEQVIQGWYKIPPPEGNYSFVSKAFVDARGDGKTGVTNRNHVAVKAVNVKDKANSYRTQTSLAKGVTVRILGKTHSYYMIEPPDGVYVYVPQSAVRIATAEEIRLAQRTTQDDTSESVDASTQPALASAAGNTDTGAVEAQPATQGGSTEPVDTSTEPALAIAPTPPDLHIDVPQPTTQVYTGDSASTSPVFTIAQSKSDTVDVEPRPTTQSDWTEPATSSTEPAIAVATSNSDITDIETQPTTQSDWIEPATSLTEPAIAVASTIPDLIEVEWGNPQSVATRPGSLLAKVEKRFREISELPVHTQPIDELLAEYRRLDAKHLQGLTPTQQVLIDTRITHLRRRSILLDSMGKIARAGRSDPSFIRQSRQHGSEARSVSKHDAIGWLLASSVYNGRRLPRLYRLVDPANNRTIAYVRADAKVDTAAYLGRLVALKGETSFDADLKLRVLDVEAALPVRLASPGP